MLNSTSIGPLNTEKKCKLSWLEGQRSIITTFGLNCLNSSAFDLIFNVCHIFGYLARPRFIDPLVLEKKI